MSDQEPLPLRLPVPDAECRLPAEDRARILAGFDVDAVERLLGMTRPEPRRDILGPFLPREGGERLGILVGLNDPELRRVLEEVWAPMWDEVGATDAEIEANLYHYPGREIALARRRAARARPQLDGST